MNLEMLLESAKVLPIPTENAVNEYSEKREKLVAEINSQLLARTDIKDLVGVQNIDMMKDNHHNHVQFMESLLKNMNPEVLVETVHWVFKVYRSRGFHPAYWSSQMSAWKNILQNELSKESFDSIWPIYNWMLVNTPIFSKITDS